MYNEVINFFVKQYKYGIINVNKIENENRGIQTMKDNFNYLKEEINNLTKTSHTNTVC